jgi:hypothetical protein
VNIHPEAVFLLNLGICSQLGTRYKGKALRSSFLRYISFQIDDTWPLSNGFSDGILPIFWSALLEFDAELLQRSEAAPADSHPKVNCYNLEWMDRKDKSTSQKDWFLSLLFNKYWYLPCIKYFIFPKKLRWVHRRIHLRFFVLKNGFFNSKGQN